jgi:hypothetical protein
MNNNPIQIESASVTAEEIKNLIEKHRVCFESWYEYAMVGGVRSHTGYALRLSGINNHETGEHGVPGCTYCRQTYSDLCSVAKWILPPDDRASQYRIEPFDSSFHIAKTRGHREEVVVTIQVLHRDDPDRPADECEMRCLGEMRQKLKEFGVMEGRVNDQFEKGQKPELIGGKIF